MPIQRNQALQPLSREHHHGLLFVWKIREGLKKQVSMHRLTTYTGWYWRHHIRPHFFQEEKILLPFLPDHPLTKRMKTDHDRIRELIIDIDNDPLRGDLVHLTDLLEKHIRFEEREFFQHLQKILSAEELERIAHQLEEHPVSCEDWKDEFWK